MSGKMKKSTVIVTIVLALLVTVVVGYYAWLSGKSRATDGETAVTATQLVLNRDLEKNYPGTPREVVRFYTEIQMCFYNEECTEEEIRQLGMKARELFDEELQENNEPESYLERLEQEIEEFKAANKRLSGANVAATVNVDTFTEDGYDFARIYCGYTVVDGSGTTSIGQVYLLRRDENKRWRIYGWEASDRVNPGQSG